MMSFRNTLSCWLILVAAAFAERPTLDDDRLNDMLHKAREYDLPRIVYHDRSDTWLIGDKEIGPSGVRHTLATMEFPWRHAGGRFQDGVTRKFVYPPDTSPEMVYLRRHVTVNSVIYDRPPRLTYRYVTRPSWQWKPGTVFFDLHYANGFPSRLRIIEKNERGYGFDKYDVFLFAPFRSEEEVEEATGVELDPIVQTRQITSGHPQNPFTAQEKVHYYPDVDVDWVKLVKERKWPETTGTNWFHAGQKDGWVNERNSHDWIVGSTHESCAKCHDTFGEHVDNFEFNREWYAFTQGGDGVASYYPIDLRSISYSGPNGKAWGWANN